MDSNCRYSRGGKVSGYPLFWRTVAAVRVLARTSISTAAGAGISTASRTCIGTPTGTGVCASARTCISTAPRPCVGTPTWAGICASTRTSISTAAGARISAASRTCIGTPTGTGVCASARTCVAIAGPCGLILGNCRCSHVGGDKRCCDEELHEVDPLLALAQAEQTVRCSRLQVE